MGNLISVYTGKGSRKIKTKNGKTVKTFANINTLKDYLFITEYRF